ncbi:hypothetical protein CFN78_05050 [Amycolatopsis antarctica]|uniref:Uncharacterized protein n=1 Tax=Amycolatopsis antarctica TaxID=1854586 RepID=A0A263DAT4_9PSEU|nr:maleylpyruvate isomerase family mycothiol-dependent enzyme [Amycolatopsis antarctica]OZM74485.1 hypothetical protein CFN78_05050 [Amycolatopsis antarctica]
MQVADVVTEVTTGQARLALLLDGLDEDAARSASRLPGWTRGHVLTHLEQVVVAFARQAEYARRGELVEVYDGGRPGRDAAIEANAGRPAAALRSAVFAANERLATAWAELEPGDWSAAVRYRDSNLLATAFCVWREIEIHTADADIGYEPGEWSADFCAHVVEFLRPRVPAGARLLLAPADARQRWDLGEGEPVTVRGPLAGITAWLAGRDDGTGLDSGGAALPVLLAWP